VCIPHRSAASGGFSRLLSSRRTRTRFWGTDATRFYTEEDGWCWFFGAIDHHTDELLGWHVTKLGDRWAALEPIRQGVRQAFHGFSKEVARGLRSAATGDRSTSPTPGSTK